MPERAHFEITWDNGDGEVELVGPLIQPRRFETVREAYQYWKRRHAHRSDAPLVVHAKSADGSGRAHDEGLGSLLTHGLGFARQRGDGASDGIC